MEVDSRPDVEYAEYRWSQHKLSIDGDRIARRGDIDRHDAAAHWYVKHASLGLDERPACHTCRRTDISPLDTSPRTFPLRGAWRLFLHVMPSQCRVAFLYTSAISFHISVFELLSNRHVCCSCVIASRVLFLPLKLKQVHQWGPL